MVGSTVPLKINGLEIKVRSSFCRVRDESPPTRFSHHEHLSSASLTLCTFVGSFVSLINAPVVAGTFCATSNRRYPSTMVWQPPHSTFQDRNGCGYDAKSLIECLRLIALCEETKLNFKAKPKTKTKYDPFWDF